MRFCRYADRAKEIKTHVVQNVGTVEHHVAEYQRIIENLQTEVQQYKSQLAAAQLGGEPAATARTESKVSSSNNANVNAPDPTEALGWVDSLANEMNENIEERINLQKAKLELQDLMLNNRYEQERLTEQIEAGAGSEFAFGSQISVFKYLSFIACLRSGAVD